MYGGGKGVVGGGGAVGGMATTGSNIGLMLVVAFVLLVLGVAFLRMAVVRR